MAEYAQNRAGVVDRFLTAVDKLRDVAFQEADSVFSTSAMAVLSC